MRSSVLKFSSPPPPRGRPGVMPGVASDRLISRQRGHLTVADLRVETDNGVVSAVQLVVVSYSHRVLADAAFTRLGFWVQRRFAFQLRVGAELLLLMDFIVQREMPRPGPGDDQRGDFRGPGTVRGSRGNRGHLAVSHVQNSESVVAG